MLLYIQPRKEKSKRFEVSLWIDLICHSRSLLSHHSVRKNPKICTFQVLPQHLPSVSDDHHGEGLGGGMVERVLGPSSGFSFQPRDLWTSLLTPLSPTFLI